ncbi:hypothetical protein ABPG75_006875 [Micractinium tetrahymenae]
MRPGAQRAAAITALLLAGLLQLGSAARLGPSHDGRSLLMGEGVWQNYTRDDNSLLLGPHLLSSTAATSDAGCAELCNSDPVCNWWSWCPLSTADGCPVLRYCNATGADATPELLPAGTCLLSTESVTQGRVASSVAVGPAVPWTGGQWDPQQPAGGGGARRLQSAGSDGQAAALSPRRPGRQLRAATDPLIWLRFTHYNNTFLRGPALVGTAQAASEEECASACGDSALCEQWALCPASAVLGCQALDFCGADATPTMVPAGTCLLSYDPQPGRDAFVIAKGELEVRLIVKKQAVDRGRAWARNHPEQIFARNRHLPMREPLCPDAACGGIMESADVVKPAKPPPEPLPAVTPAPKPAKRQAPAVAAAAEKKTTPPAAAQQQGSATKPTAKPAGAAPTRALLGSRASARSLGGSTSSASGSAPTFAQQQLAEQRRQVAAARAELAATTRAAAVARSTSGLAGSGSGSGAVPALRHSLSAPAWGGGGAAAAEPARPPPPPPEFTLADAFPELGRAGSEAASGVAAGGDSSGSGAWAGQQAAEAARAASSASEAASEAGSWPLDGLAAAAFGNTTAVSRACGQGPLAGAAAGTTAGRAAGTTAGPAGRAAAVPSPPLGWDDSDDDIDPATLAAALRQQQQLLQAAWASGNALWEALAPTPAPTPAPAPAPAPVAAIKEVLMAAVTAAGTALAPATPPGVVPQALGVHDPLLPPVPEPVAVQVHAEPAEPPPAHADDPEVEALLALMGCA